MVAHPYPCRTVICSDNIMLQYHSQFVYPQIMNCMPIGKYFLRTFATVKT